MILPPSTAATVIMVMISMPGCPAPFSINGAGQPVEPLGQNQRPYALWYNGQFGEDNSTCYARSAPPARRPR